MREIMNVIREIISAIREYIRNYREIIQGCLNFNARSTLDMNIVDLIVHM